MWIKDIVEKPVRQVSKNLFMFFKFNEIKSEYSIFNAKWLEILNFAIVGLIFNFQH